MNTAAAQYRARTTHRRRATDLVIQHADLVRRIAHHLAARLPASVEIDDLMQAGMIGLLEASRSYDAEQGASFETYASHPHPRLDDRRDPPRRLGAAFGAPPRPPGRRQRCARSNSAPAVPPSPAKWRRDRNAAARIPAPAGRCRARPGAEPGIAHRRPRRARHRAYAAAPRRSKHLERSEFRQQLVKAIGHLPEREQLVLSLYYEQELNLKEIGAVLGVSESRVCQIHGQAMVRLRGRLQVFEKADAGLEDND